MVGGASNYCDCGGISEFQNIKIFQNDHDNLRDTNYITLFPARVSDDDINDITKLNLDYNDFQNLYAELPIPSHEVTNTVHSTGTRNVIVNAREVLKLWRHRRGQLATRQAILKALDGCRNRDAREQLEETWKLKGEFIICNLFRKRSIASYLIVILFLIIRKSKS